MKKKIIAAFLCLSMALTAFPITGFAAEGIVVDETTFPDAKFRNYISKTTYGEDGILTDAEMGEVTTLQLRSMKIASLEGIQYFTSLESLDCFNNKLTELPDLPDSITMLNCGNNDLTILEDLPASLEELYCANCDLTEIKGFPGGVTLISCSQNKLKSLPTLPEYLEELRCNDNELEQLPVLPDTVELIQCQTNKLTKLPELPESLYQLKCFDNQLSSLPELPSGLTELDCSGNEISVLPEIPGKMKWLDFGTNNIEEIPALPAALQTLDCTNNKIKNLPELPESLLNLYCSSNQLRELPELPDTISNLYVGDNALTMLPELPESLSLLYCYENKLIELPALPAGLEDLDCSNNVLTELPELNEVLRILKCDNNKLASLPALPESLTYLSCANNELEQLPVLPAALKELDCSHNQLTQVVLCGEIEYWRINVSYNNMKDTSDVTGNTGFEWNDTSFVFSPQNGDIKNPFVDVSGDSYYYNSVLWALTNGVTAGLTETEFAPNISCTRAQVVTFLWRAMGKPEPETEENPFTDVAKGQYYYKAILWAVENGITSGLTADKFAPDATVTRGQFVTFLYRTEGKPDYSSGNPFTDVASGQYYHNAILWAVENGITYGLSNTLFGPEASCTRGQVVTFLYRALG